MCWNRATGERRGGQEGEREEDARSPGGDLCCMGALCRLLLALLVVADMALLVVADRKRCLMTVFVCFFACVGQLA